MKTPHLRGIPVSNELLFDMLTKGWSAQFVETQQGLPQDAEFVYSYVEHNYVVLVFSHPSFSECPAGALPEYGRVTFFKRFYPDVDALLKQHIEEDKVLAEAQAVAK